ncbi:MAG: LAGLIDADG family homing endonuclease [Promethearchaeota archaeon]
MTEEIDFIARFEEFLKSYKTEEGDTPYYDAIGRLSLENLISVSIDFNHLLTFDPNLAEATKEDPKRAIEAASAAIRRILRIVDPDYSDTVENLHARFKEVPDRVSVRFIRSEHIGQLIMVDALVTRVSDVKPLLVEGVFQCRQCQEIIYVPQGNQFIAPSLCTNDACRSKGPFDLIPERSKFVDWQKIRLQEKPEELPPGALPRALDCILQDDLVDIARPGDPCRVVGILRSTQDTTARTRRKAPTFSVFLATNYVAVSEREADRVEITPKEEEQIQELAQDPLIHRKLVNSIAPSIYGLTDIKEAVCLLLFGGVSKVLPDGVKIRGDSNILLVGDPGTGKSQILKFVAQIAPRGLYTSGKGSTAAGLTAAVLRDPDTEGFALEAGALVLADRGTAAIDEFDKMRPQDRTAIHEAMEQHSFHPSFEVMFSSGEKQDIGSYVDYLFEEMVENKIQGVQCDILPLPESDFGIITTDFNSIFQTRINRVSRHRAPNYFIKLRFSNGRDILVTPEHPIFIFTDNKIKEIPAEEIQEGSFVPGIKKLNISNKDITLETNINKGRKKVSLPSKLTVSLARFLGYYLSEGYCSKGSTYEVGLSNIDTKVVQSMKQVILDCFGIKPLDYVGKNRTLRIVSKSLYNYLFDNFPKLMRKSLEKRIPYQIFNSSYEIKVAFLNAAFEGDGGIESEAIAYSTSSKGLAEDYQDLLLSLGIHTRIFSEEYQTRKSKRTRTRYKVYIRGYNLPFFAKLIIPKLCKQHAHLKWLIERSANFDRNYDILPTDVRKMLIDCLRSVGASYKTKFLQFLQKDYAITRKLVDKFSKVIQNRLKILETEVKSSNNFQLFAQPRLIEEEETVASNIENFIINHEELDRVKKILSIIDHLKTFNWLRINKIEKIRNSGKFITDWVYDVTVEPTHCFVSHGLILHNTVSIAKAGIVATLNARTAILAAANPNLGRYVPERSFAENVNLPATLLSRFDLIFTLTDLPETERDERTADHIIQLHQHKGVAKDPPISADLLRKYIAYARRSITPTLTDEALNVVKDFYLGMRKSGERENAPVPITARQLESLIRLAEAHAKMALREKVLAEDAQAAVRIVQVTLQQVGFDQETGQYDIDNIMIGRAKSQRDRLQAILVMIRELEKETPGGVPLDKLEERAQLDGISADFVRQAVIQLRDKDGLIFEPRPGKLKYIKGA